MNLKLIDHLKKKKTLMWWTTHPAAYTRCFSGSQLPCYYFSLIGTIRACFLNHKEHTAEKKMVDFALPSSPSLIFTTKSCNFSRLMSPFVSHKFPVIVFQLHHMKKTRLFLIRVVCARVHFVWFKKAIFTASYICLQQIQLQYNQYKLTA